jgi:hypothetical protein
MRWLKHDKPIISSYRQLAGRLEGLRLCSLDMNLQSLFELLFPMKHPDCSDEKNQVKNCALQ